MAIPARPSVPLRRARTTRLPSTSASRSPPRPATTCPELEAWLAGTLVAGVRNDDHVAAGITAINLGVLRTWAGRYAESSRLLAEAVAQFERRDPFGYLSLAYGFMVGVAYELGDLAEAERGMEPPRGGGDRAIPDKHLPYHARIQSRGAPGGRGSPSRAGAAARGGRGCERMPLSRHRSCATTQSAPARPLARSDGRDRPGATERRSSPGGVRRPHQGPRGR